MEKRKRKTGSIVIAAGLLALCFVVLPEHGQAAQGLENTKSTERTERTESLPASVTVFAMDTVITLEAYGGQTEKAVQTAEAMVGKLESLWSVTREGSEINQANHGSGNPVSISAETEALVSHTLQLAEDTDGALNPALYPIIKAWGFTTGEYRIPETEKLQRLLQNADYRDIRLKERTLTLPEAMEVDFGAVAKGYTGDLLAETLKAHGVTSAIINLGGNVALVGDRPDGSAWRIGIRSPYGEGNMGVLEASDSHIITSGGYERYFTGEDGTVYWHIMDPATGAPARSGIISATIVGKEGWRCDGLSTAVFVMGLEEATQYWRTRKDFDMILVTEENEVYVTEGLWGRFHLNEASRKIPIHMIR